jgi:hypothetical protein
MTALIAIIFGVAIAMLSLAHNIISTRTLGRRIDGLSGLLTERLKGELDARRVLEDTLTKEIRALDKRMIVCSWCLAIVHNANAENGPKMLERTGNDGETIRIIGCHHCIPKLKQMGFQYAKAPLGEIAAVEEAAS